MSAPRLLLTAWLIPLLACSAPAAEPCPHLHVLAAQSLEPPLRSFAADRADVRISYGASGLLLRQIERGAPVALFLPAGVDEAEAAAGGAETIVFAANRLVLAVPAGDPGKIGGVEGLTRGDVRVAIGRAPMVPGGRHARDALSLLGIATEVEKQLVEAESTPQALAWLRGGLADAGLVYRSDVQAAGGAVRELVELPLRTPIVYPAVVFPGACEEKARAFVEALRRSPVLAAHGFETP